MLNCFILSTGLRVNKKQEKEMRLNLGLQKLIQGAKDVAAMKIVLAEEQKKLEVATAETMKMLSSLEVSSAEARKEGDQARNERHMYTFLRGRLSRWRPVVIVFTTRLRTALHRLSVRKQPCRPSVGFCSTCLLLM